MCISQNVSIAAYIIGLAGSVGALSTKQYDVGVLGLAVIHVQLLEAFLWRALNTRNMRLNISTTNLIYLVLAFHAIAAGVGIIAQAHADNQKVTWGDAAPLIAGTVLFLSIVAVFPYDKQPSSVIPRSSGATYGLIQYGFQHSTMWYSGVMIFIILVAWTFMRLDTAALITLYAGASLMISKLISSSSSASIGSMWCLTSAFLLPLFVGVNYYLRKKEDDAKK